MSYRFIITVGFLIKAQCDCEAGRAMSEDR